jgi:hypothetical protein
MSDLAIVGISILSGLGYFTIGGFASHWCGDIEDRVVAVLLWPILGPAMAGHRLAEALTTRRATRALPRATARELDR